MPRHKKSFSLFSLLDSFVKSINRMGEGSSWITAAIFIGGGTLATWMGYTDNYMPNLLGGPLAILIGLILFFRAWDLHRKYKQQKREKRKRRSLTV